MIIIIIHDVIIILDAALGLLQSCRGRKIEEEIDDFVLMRPEKFRSVLVVGLAEVFLAQLNDDRGLAVHQAVDGRMLDVRAAGVLDVAVHQRFAEEAF